MRLKIRARTEWKGKKQSHPVVIQDTVTGPVIQILGTPGSWYLKTLNENPVPMISIDHGIGWTCINIDEIRQSANRIMMEVERDY